MQAISTTLPIDLVEFPFPFQIGDDTWTVWRKGSKFGMELTDAGIARPLTETEALKHWNARQ